MYLSAVLETLALATVVTSVLIVAQSLIRCVQKPKLTLVLSQECMTKISVMADTYAGGSKGLVISRALATYDFLKQQEAKGGVVVVHRHGENHTVPLE